MTSLEKRNLLARVKTRFYYAETVQCLEHKTPLDPTREIENFEIFEPDLDTMYLSQQGPGYKEYSIRCKDKHKKTEYILLYRARDDEYATVMKYKKRMFDNSGSYSDTFLDEQLKNLQNGIK